MKPLIALASFALFVSPAWSQTSSLAANINNVGEPYSGEIFGARTDAPYLESEALLKVGNFWFFAGSTLLSGSELYRTDGTGPGTSLVKDINPTGSSAPDHFIELNGLLYFTANGGSHGTELWRSDGTTAGTFEVKDVNPGTKGSEIESMAVVGGRLVFSANDGTVGKELWSSDGTQAGTNLVMDVNPGPWHGSPLGMTLDASGSFLLFSAQFSGLGVELWRTDGTNAGTSMVLDLNPGLGESRPESFVSWNGQTFFSAKLPGAGHELWVTDGTAPGTAFVKDIYAGLQSSNPQLGEAVAYNGALYFAGRSANDGIELWRTDGTAVGTQMVADINPGLGWSNPESLRAFNGQLYFSAETGPGFGRELHRLDQNGVGLVADIFPGPNGGMLLGDGHLQEVGGKLFFVANDGLSGPELWTTDGSVVGTHRVADIAPGNLGSLPRGLTGVGGQQMIFSAWHPELGRELWTSDGTAAGAKLVKEIDSGFVSGDSFPSDFVSANGMQLYFSARESARKLWSWDAQAGGVLQVDGGLFMNYASGIYSGMAGGELLTVFSAAASSVGEEPWIAGKTPAETKVLKDIAPGLMGSKPGGFMSDGKLIYFSALDGKGRELWATDGTEAGTFMVKDIMPGTASSQPALVGVLNGKLILEATVPGEGRVLMSSDGTDAGTVMLYDSSVGIKYNFYAGGGGGTKYYRFGDHLMFRAASAGHGAELWMTDGTAAGTEPMPEILPGLSPSDPSLFFEVNGKLLFTAKGTSGTFRLWSADPILKTVQVVSGIEVADQSLTVPGGTDVAVVDGWAYFVGDDPARGKELWRTDGTTAGTNMVIDLAPGSAESRPRYLTAANGGVYFSAVNSPSGNVIHFSDGTAAGTTAAVQAPGAGGTEARYLTLVDGELLYSANAPYVGNELFRMQNIGPYVTELPSNLGLGRLTATTPRLGSALTIECTGIPPGTLSLLGVSAPVLVPTALLTLPGSTAWLDPGSVSLLGYFSGSSFSWSTTLPLDASLAGLRVNVQAYFAFGGSFPAATSNGLSLGLDF